MGSIIVLCQAHFTSGAPRELERLQGYGEGPRTNEELRPEILSNANTAPSGLSPDTNITQ